MTTLSSSPHRTRICRVLSLLAVSAALLGVPAHGSLLTSDYGTQLGTWLGQGELAFTNIFTKEHGDGQTSFDFHAAADGQGPTFTLMQVSAPDFDTRNGYGADLPTQVVGGYNPQSWFALDANNPNPSVDLNNFYASATEAGRTAFIFNLSDSVIQRQNVSADYDLGDEGGFQTYNAMYWGPTFGAGFDLASFNELESGSAYSYGYGTPVFQYSITSGATDPFLNVDFFRIDRLEVYTFTPVAGPQAVPDASATIGLMICGLVGLMGMRRTLSRT